VGRKRLDTLILAMALTLRDVPEARLRIAGSGPLLEQLQKLATELGLQSEQVQFLGTLHPARVRVELSACHVFCLASVQEASGIAPLEAMATGRAVVATRAGAIPEIVADAGILVPPESPAALAQALTEVLLSPDARRDLSRRARLRAESCSWSTSA
jgi:glycosyltransferase involved in cell wall biosynthesis